MEKLNRTFSLLKEKIKAGTLKEKHRKSNKKARSNNGEQNRKGTSDQGDRNRKSHTNKRLVQEWRAKGEP